ncbi:hypothetical protein [Flavobacterium sp. GCM10023249]|uniref:hypothetical protein n=1 Tax=unclassified Flavobacterium TaxID=196869 RepID=UPI0036199100
MRNLEKFQSQQLNDTELLSVRGGNPIFVAGMLVAAVVIYMEHDANSSSSEGSNPGSTAGAGAVAGVK